MDAPPTPPGQEKPATAASGSPPPGAIPGASSYAEPVWTYRGYQIRASEFTTAMSHFFRAEVQRANIWRQRLDTTTNWAVVTTGAVLSFSFTQIDSNHLVILLNLVLVTMFLSIEARRYRYYELWAYRVRLMETDFFAAMLVPPFHPSPDWAETLAENLLHPDFPISIWEALGRRLRRNYLWIYTVIGAAWMAKLWLFPGVAASVGEFIDRSAVGSISGRWVALSALLFYLALAAISLITVGLHRSTGEVLPRFGAHSAGEAAGQRRAWFRPSRRRRQYLTFIITSQTQAVSERIMKDMGRGCTALAGTGMFSGESRSVLMIALSVTEIPQLKALVRSADPDAFVIVSPAEEVFGRGFSSLEGET